MVNGAQIMVKCLEKEGVKVVFGYPGYAYWREGVCGRGTGA